MSYAALTHACTLCGSQHHSRSACPWKDYTAATEYAYSSIMSEVRSTRLAALLLPKQGEPNVPGHQHAAAAETPA